MCIQDMAREQLFSIAFTSTLHLHLHTGPQCHPDYPDTAFHRTKPSMRKANLQMGATGLLVLASGGLRRPVVSVRWQPLGSTQMAAPAAAPPGTKSMH